MRRTILVASWLLATPLVGQGTVVSYPLGAVAPRAWSVGQRPLLEIGGIDGRGPAEFTNVVGVSRLSDGHIVVANRRTAELRLFSPSGQFVRALIRKGKGPNELEELDGFHALGDTLVVIEGREAVHIGVAPEYAFARHPRPSVDGYIIVPALGALSATAILLRMNKGTITDMNTIRLDSQWIARLDTRESRVHFLGSQPRPPVFGTPGRRAITPLGFAPDLEVAVGNGRFCTGFSERHEFACREANGRAQFTVRRAMKAVPVTEPARKLFRNAVMGIRADGTSRLEGRLLAYRRTVAAAAQFATHYPEYGRLLLARTGDLWVKAYVAEDDGIGAYDGSASVKPTTWSIYDPDGKWIADCPLPVRFTLMEVGADYVIGVSRDDDDVERVALWPLQR